MFFDKKRAKLVDFVDIDFVRHAFYWSFFCFFQILDFNQNQINLTGFNEYKARHVKIGKKQ